MGGVGEVICEGKRLGLFTGADPGVYIRVEQQRYYHSKLPRECLVRYSYAWSNIARRKAGIYPGSNTMGDEGYVAVIGKGKRVVARIRVIQESKFITRISRKGPS